MKFRVKFRLFSAAGLAAGSGSMVVNQTHVCNTSEASAYVLEVLRKNNIRRPDESVRLEVLTVAENVADHLLNLIVMNVQGVSAAAGCSTMECPNVEESQPELIVFCPVLLAFAPWVVDLACEYVLFAGLIAGVFLTALWYACFRLCWSFLDYMSKLNFRDDGDVEEEDERP